MGAGMRESQPNKESLVATLTAAAKQRTAEVNGAEVQLMETVAADDEAAMQFPEHSLFREARSYYRGVKENSRSTGQIVFSTSACASEKRSLLGLSPSSSVTSRPTW